MYYSLDIGNGSRIIDLETGNILGIANLPDPMWDYIGTWGPDGRYYFLTTERGNVLWQLHAHDVDTGDFELIRKQQGRSIGLPSWSQDGSIV